MKWGQPAPTETLKTHGLTSCCFHCLPSYFHPVTQAYWVILISWITDKLVKNMDSAIDGFAFWQLFTDPFWKVNLEVNELLKCSEHCWGRVKTTSYLLFLLAFLRPIGSGMMLFGKLSFPTPATEKQWALVWRQWMRTQSMRSRTEGKAPRSDSAPAEGETQGSSLWLEAWFPCLEPRNDRAQQGHLSSPLFVIHFSW